LKGEAKVERNRSPLKRGVMSLNLMTGETALDIPRLDDRLYSIGQITAATFVGSPLAGCLLLAHNYRVLRQSRAALYSLMCGVVATVIVFVGASWLPESFPNAALPVGYCFAIRQVSVYVQGASIADHLSAGGKKGTWAMTIGIGLASLVLVVGLFFGVLMLWYSVAAT
jgi:hypothetical protein